MNYFVFYCNFHGNRFFSKKAQKKTRTSLSVATCEGCSADKVEKYMRNKKFKKRSINLYKLEVSNPNSLVSISCQS